MSSKFLFSVILFFFTFSVVGQVVKVKGSIKDSEGVPLVGASVLVKGTSKGAVADFDGKYEISVKKGDVLLYTFIGMIPKEVKVTKSASYEINVVLLEDAQELGEVVVMGYGTERKIASVVGSVAVVSSKEIAKRPSSNAFDALQGKVAGLQVYTSSGQPGVTSSVRLNGVGSLRGSTRPLYVIDGIPVSESIIPTLNPNDFENISVLKDASATSLYGSRAANGVIFITTRKGGLNRDAEISISSQIGFSNLVNKDFFNSMMNSEELIGFWKETRLQSQKSIEAITSKYNADTRWENVFFNKDALMRKIDASISGGGSNITYYISAGYSGEKGVKAFSRFDAYNFRMNINGKLKDWLRFGMTSSMGYNERENAVSAGGTRNNVNGIINFPFYPTHDENGNEYELIPGLNSYHPNYFAKKHESPRKRVDLAPSGFVTITPVRGLTIKSQVGMQYYTSQQSGYRLPSYKGNLSNGRVSESITKYITKTMTNTIEYKFNIAQKNHFTLLAGQESFGTYYEEIEAVSTGQIKDEMLLLSSGRENKDVSQEKEASAVESLFAKVEYDWDNRYLFDVSFRRDGSSKFGKSSRYGNFWSAGVMWKAKREKFLKNVSWLNDLSFKFSIGSTGNSGGIGAYQSLQRISTSVYEKQSGYYLHDVGNPNLSWEVQQQTNFTINAYLFDKVSLSAEFYNRLTKNMLLAVPKPYSTGIASQTQNVGELQNRGINVTLSVDALRTKDYNLSPYVNFGYNRDKLLEIFDGKEFYEIPNTGVSYVVGEGVNFAYPIFHSIDAQTGTPRWYVPGEKKYKTHKDENQLTSTFDRESLTQNTGIRRYAPIAGGFGLNAAYKGLSLNVDFSFVYKKYLINNDRFFTENPYRFGTAVNMNKNVFDYWKQPGDQTRFPKLGVNFTEFDTRLIEDASFIRMKNITLGYSLPESVLSQTKFFNQIRFYVTGRNLLTFTKYSGFDPEVDSNLSLGGYPNTKQVVFGVDVKF